jgi:tetratricopeptide (TPR) repeat protein
MQESPLLVATTLAGPLASPARVEAALASAARVADVCLLLDTGRLDLASDPEMDSIRAAATRGAGSKLQIKRIGWRNDFAWARNQALEEAAKTGASWSVFVDSDEELHVDPDLATTLSALGSEVQAAYLRDSTGSYTQVRFVRLPAQARYEGLVHEAISLVGPTIAGNFWGAPKTEEQSRRKNARDLEALYTLTKKEPECARWHYYYGQTLELVGRDTEAIAAFERCLNRSSWDEEIAWSAYRAADLEIRAKRFERAATLCQRGITAHAGIPELFTRWAQAMTWLGQNTQAARLARIALSLPLEPRRGFTDVYWQREGAFRMLAWSLDKLGDTAGAAAAQAEEQALLTRRTGPALTESSVTNLGRWDAWYAKEQESKAYGDDKTYALGSVWLCDLEVEDWGCGLGWFARHVGANGPRSVLGIDGSHSNYATVVEDLIQRQSQPEGVFLRHVLEHDRQWPVILRNAVASFRKRMVLVIFTPWNENGTEVLGETVMPDGFAVPTLSFRRKDLVDEFASFLVREETVSTDTQYGIEHVFYLEK